MLTLRLTSLLLLLFTVSLHAPPARADETASPQKSALEVKCDDGQAYFCLLAGNKLQEAGKPGARAAFAKACEGGQYHGCDLAGDLFYQGVDGPVDLAAARQTYETACYNAARSCPSLAAMYRAGEGGALAKTAALSLYKDACISLDQESCFHWGDMLETGDGVPADAAAAQRAFRSACSDGSGYAPACERLD